MLLFPDGTTLTHPDSHAIAQRVGLQTEAETPFYDLIVIGAGPAGLGRRGLRRLGRGYASR